MKRVGHKPSVYIAIRLVMVLSIFPFYSLLSSGAHGQNLEERASRQIWNFDVDLSGTLPKFFTVRNLVDARPAGGWKVINMENSPELLQDLDRLDQTRIRKMLQTFKPPSPPHVLTQLKSAGFEHDYNVVVVEGTTAADFDLKVSFLPIAGKGEMGGRLIWRAQDHRNYYISRANPLEQNIRFYRLVNGVRYKLDQFRSYYFRDNLAHSPRDCPRPSFPDFLRREIGYSIFEAKRFYQGKSDRGQRPMPSHISMCFFYRS